MTLRLKKNLSDDERHAAWANVIERIHTEQVNGAWSHYMFRLMRSVFAKNPTLSEEGGFIFNWVAENYVDASLMLLRRELDQQAGVENLMNLLFDIIEHPTVLTRARYLANWGERALFDRELANREFDSFNLKRVANTQESDYIDPEGVRADINQVVTNAAQLREYAERTRAHRTPEKKANISDVTFKALHNTSSDLRRVISKYYLLLTLKSCKWQPVPQFVPIAPFTRPWVLDPQGVAKAAEEGSEGA
jgi:hypothetical protein